MAEERRCIDMALYKCSQTGIVFDFDALIELVEDIEDPHRLDNVRLLGGLIAHRSIKLEAEQYARAFSVFQVIIDTMGDDPIAREAFRYVMVANERALATAPRVL